MTSALADFVAATAAELGIPGAAVGVLADGAETTVAHGVTSADHPAPVTERTLFHLASLTKPFTATALVRLAAEGKLDLHAPVRRYVPELRLADARAEAQITVFQLLNHTSGLDWQLVGAEADETLPGFVAKLAELKQIAPPGARASYSQAGYNLAGRVLEHLTGQSFEQAVTELVLTPAGLSNTFFDLDEVLIRPFAVGHNRDEDGRLSAARPWKAWRAGTSANNPGGGLISSVSNLLRWAKFQLADGAGALPAEAVRGMREQTAELRASTLGDGVGIGWFLREVDGVRTIGHGGSGNGQFSELLIAPDRDFAVVSLANAGPDGNRFNQAVLRWALEHHLGVVQREAEPVPFEAARAEEVAGHYEIDAMNLDISTDGGKLVMAVAIKPEIRQASADMPPDYPPAAFGFLPGDGEEYVITEGGLKGQRGYFSRDASGAVTGVDLAGRLFSRSR
ncbi:serine hydrolase domain-containing protein [Crossiella sp. NPDC003009]